MQVHIIKPFRSDKNLGLGYNQAMQLIGDDDWACLCDLDTCFLTPDAGNILFEYANQNPTAGLLTCYTNRVSALSRKQLINGTVSEDPDIKHHIAIAEQRKRLLYTTSFINRDISGMLMMISKKTWTNYKFPEHKQCLGVDTDYGRLIRAAGLQIVRMNGLYIFHTYRIMTNVNDKSHLI